MKISRDRLKQIIKEELQSLALAEVEHTASDEEERDTAQSPERKRGERLKPKLFSDVDGLVGTEDTALGGRTLQPDEPIRDLEGTQAYTDAANATSGRLSSPSQDAGVYMARGAFDPTNPYEAETLGMLDPDVPRSDRDSGKDIPDYMRAGYKGDAPKTRLRDTETDEEKEARIGGRFKGTKFIPTRSRKGGGNLAAAKKAMRAARAAVKTELAKPENKGKSIYDLDKSEGSPRAKFASAYKALKRAKAGRGASRVAKKTLRPLGVSPKLRTRPPGLPDSRSPAAKQRMADGTPLTGPKTGGPLSPEERRAAAGNVDYFKKRDSAVAKAPTKKATRKSSLSDMTQTELDVTRRELAAGDVPTDENARRIYNTQVKRRIAKLRKERPNLSPSQRRVIAKTEAKKDVMNTASRMIAAKNRQERDRGRTNMVTGVDLE